MTATYGCSCSDLELLFARIEFSTSKLFVIVGADFSTFHPVPA